MGPPLRGNAGDREIAPTGLAGDHTGLPLRGWVGSASPLRSLRDSPTPYSLLPTPYSLLPHLILNSFFMFMLLAWVSATARASAASSGRAISFMFSSIFTICCT